MENHKEKFISKYGSIKATPITVGPCRKINPVIGIKNALVLLVEFKDKKHSYEPKDFQNLLFSKGSHKSMRDYYLEASWNQVDITGKVNDEWYSVAGNRADYADIVPVNRHYPLARKLVKETILQAKDEGKIDFTPFASDGKIDMLIVVYAGKGLDTGLDINYIRPHQDRLEEPLEVQNGIWADRYCLVSELPFDDIGCYCHEIGHLLGLPDLYKEGYSPVVGSWCLMGIGDHLDNGRTPAHPSAWCKIHLGWREPELINKPPEIQDIPAVLDDDGVIYKLEVQGTDGREYFLLENRQQKGFDRYLPGNGLLIWHVDESRCLYQAPNSDPEHFFLTLEQSDGKNELQRDMTVLIKEKGVEVARKELTGDDGDAFPGVIVNRNFDDKSNPNSNSHNGAKSLVGINSISDSDEVMKAHMGVQTQSRDESLETPANTIKSSADETAKLVLQNFIDLMTKEEDKDPYDEGYEAGKLDIIEEEKNKPDLDLFKKGYKQGYSQGYIDAWEKFRNNK
ncbi:MAG: M6 family metalloprotease domain-containing protein [Methanobacterium sp.]